MKLLDRIAWVMVALGVAAAVTLLARASNPNANLPPAKVVLPPGIPAVLPCGHPYQGAGAEIRQTPYYACTHGHRFRVEQGTLVPDTRPRMRLPLSPPVFRY